MIGLARSTLLFAVVAVVVAAVDLAMPGLIGDPTVIDSTPAGRVATVLTTLIAALIIALPDWRWWRITARALSVAMLGWAAWYLTGFGAGLGTGLLAAITLVALGCASTTIPAIRGRWPVALATSSVLGLTLYAIMDPHVQAISAQAVDRFADIPAISAVVVAIAAFALLSQAWSEAPERSLHMPRWIGLALTITCMSLVFVGWHYLIAAERADVMRQAKIGTQAMGQALQADLDQMVEDFAAMDDEGAPPTGAADPAMVARFAQISSNYPGIIALEWVNPAGEVEWASTLPSIKHPGRAGLGPREMRERAIARARATGEVAIADPLAENGSLASLIDGRPATLIASVPPDGAGAFVAFVDVEQMMAPLGKVYSDAFDAELYFQEHLLCEVDSFPNLVLHQGGYGLKIGGLPLTLRVQPNRGLFDEGFARLPNLFLASTLLASVLIGFTAYFAQTSAHRANLSAQERGKLEQLIDGAGQVAIVATDIAGIITIFNHGAERLTGLKAAEVLRRRDSSTLFDPKELAGIAPFPAGSHPFAPLATLAKEQRAHERDWTWPRPDGGQRQVNLAANAWRDTSGALLGYIFVAVDVTEREAAMRALDTARRQSEQRSQRKSSFLASVSHEVRNPMTAILSCTDLLMDSVTTEEERQKFVTDIRSHGKHLLEVLNDILDISKIEAGQLRVELLEVRIVEVVQEVVSLMRLRAREKGIGLTLACEGNGLEALVRTDQLRLRQILMNLIGNAVKFTDRGEVAIVLRANVEAGAATVEIDVRDTGIGISPDKIRSIFESYEQADLSTSRRYGGSGLGLAISQRLAKLIDGTITVASTVGVGSTFTLRLTPQLADSAVTDEPAAHTGPSPTRLDGIRVLIVEDSPDNQRLLSTILRRSGAEVEGADNGLRGIEAVTRSGRQRPFDTILLDMQMPELDGYSTVRQLRASGYRGRIIALTGNVVEDDRGRCLDAGCDDHAIKPIAREQLLALVASKAVRTA